MYVMTCPFYVSEKKKTVSCEGRIKYFPETVKKKEYLLRHCCDDWESCEYATKLTKMYEDTEDLPEQEQQSKRAQFYLDANKHTVKKLLQRIGMMEKTAAHNNEVYQAERDRFNMSRAAADRAIINLENCIGYLLYKLGETEIDTEDFRSFMESHVVTYRVSDDQTKAVYEVKEK